MTARSSFPRPTAANGTLTLKTGWRGGFQTLTFTGGPFDHFKAALHGQPDWFGLCARAEAASKFDVHLPIRDFTTPAESGLSAAEVTAALQRALEAALAGRRVYIGCMGGWGRTGLVLALLAKVIDPDGDPVKRVRTEYSPRAVETAAQKAYIGAFEVAELRRWFLRAAWKQRLLGPDPATNCISLAQARFSVKVGGAPKTPGGYERWR